MWGSKNGIGIRRMTAVLSRGFWTLQLMAAKVGAGVSGSPNQACRSLLALFGCSPWLARAASASSDLEACSLAAPAAVNTCSWSLYDMAANRCTSLADASPHAHRRTSSAASLLSNRLGASTFMALDSASSSLARFLYWRPPCFVRLPISASHPACGAEPLAMAALNICSRVATY